ncbi:NfeD family protein [Alkalihalobacillus sp. 1P02AB]|uniref:NfeD family protein n=1 Tax=Alkalihalobacillus sp. 1P02AB TaxID=3132260 RepID=UPI0039A5119C
MEDIQQIYFIGLIIGAAITILYLLLSDFLDAILGFLDGIFNPVLVLSFLTFFCASGYLLEFLPINSFVIIAISIGVALLLVTLLNVFILVPLSNAEATLGYSEDDLRGRIAEVIISIPEDGFGEIMIRDHSGHISRSAKSFEGPAIASGTEVIVIDIQAGILYVAERENEQLDV